MKINLLLLLGLFLVSSCSSLPVGKGQAEKSRKLATTSSNPNGTCEIQNAKTYFSGMRIERDNANSHSENITFEACKTQCADFEKRHPAVCSAEAEKLVRTDLSCLFRPQVQVPPGQIPPVIAIKAKINNCTTWSEPESHETEVLLIELLQNGERRLVRGARSAIDGVVECKRIWKKRKNCSETNTENMHESIFTCYGFSGENDARYFHDYLSESGICDLQNCGYGLYSDGTNLHEIRVRLQACH